MVARCVRIPDPAMEIALRFLLHDRRSCRTRHLRIGRLPRDEKTSRESDRRDPVRSFDLVCRGFRSLGSGAAMIQVDASALRRTGWREYALRFVLGGAITVAANLIAQRFGPVVGGLFLAFPAIFPASATLVAKHEEKKKARRRSSRRPPRYRCRCRQFRRRSLGQFGIGVLCRGELAVTPPVRRASRAFGGKRRMDPRRVRRVAVVEARSACYTPQQ